MTERRCIYCDEVIHPMRLDVLPNTRTCVKCSQEPKKAGRLVTKGQGEEVETDLEILDQETFKKLSMLEKGYNPSKSDDFTFEDE